MIAIALKAYAVTLMPWCVSASATTMAARPAVMASDVLLLMSMSKI